MRLYVWEGDGISAAYHDDGTLVVLASSPEEAREVVRAKLRVEHDEPWAERQRQWDELAKRVGVREVSTLWTVARDEVVAINAGTPLTMTSDIFDGTADALDRDPDRVIDLDAPSWIAFNGGGYD